MFKLLYYCLSFIYRSVVKGFCHFKYKVLFALVIKSSFPEYVKKEAWREYNYYIIGDSSNYHRTIIVYKEGGMVLKNALQNLCPFLLELSQKTQSRIIALDFPLAPDVTYPVIHDLCYDFYLEHGDDNTFVLGPSAGGNLALSVCCMLHDNKKTQPKGLILYYPNVTYMMNARSQLKNQTILLNFIDYHYLSLCYTPNSIDRLNWKVSPILYPYLDSLAPTIIFYSNKDMLLDHQLLLVDKMGKNIESYAHNYLHGFCSRLKISKQTLPRLKGFIDNNSATV